MSDEQSTTEQSLPTAAPAQEDSVQTAQPEASQTDVQDAADEDSGANSASSSISGETSDSAGVVEPSGSTLPEGFTRDEDGHIFNPEGAEVDANFNIKLDGVIYGADNRPISLEEITGEKQTVDPVMTVPTDAPIPVKFTQTRKDINGNDFVYQYPEIRKDGQLLTHVLNYGHVAAQKLINCLFEDGTTKHVHVDELAASGVEIKQ